MSLRGLFLRFVPPGLAQAMEAESRTWFAVCPQCGDRTSIWELGGIRYKGTLTGLNYNTLKVTKTLVKCPTCSNRGWHMIVKG